MLFLPSRIPSSWIPSVAEVVFLNIKKIKDRVVLVLYGLSGQSVRNRMALYSQFNFIAVCFFLYPEIPNREHDRVQ